MYRGQALSRNYTSPQAPVYIVNGGAGNIEGNDHTFLPEKDAPWRAAHGTHHTGWVAMQPSHKQLKFMYVESRLQQVVDEFVITKSS